MTERENLSSNPTGNGQTYKDAGVDI